MIPLEKCSLVIYNIIFKYHTGCIYAPNEKEIREILNSCRAGWFNGDIVCTIQGDWREMNSEEIDNKCWKCITQEMREW